METLDVKCGGEGKNKERMGEISVKEVERIDR